MTVWCLPLNTIPPPPPPPEGQASLLHSSSSNPTPGQGSPPWRGHVEMLRLRFLVPDPQLLVQAVHVDHSSHSQFTVKRDSESQSSTRGPRFKGRQGLNQAYFTKKYLPIGIILKPWLSSFKWGMVACSPPRSDWVSFQNVEVTWLRPAQLRQKQ